MTKTRTARWLAASLLLAGCKVDSAARDRQIIDVHAERQGEGVMLRVFVKNLGATSGESSKGHSNEYCVTAAWARDGSVVAMAEACVDEELRSDHVGVVKIFQPSVPRDGRVVVRVAMKKEDCPDCYQDEADGEWTMLSP